MGEVAREAKDEFDAALLAELTTRLGPNLPGIILEYAPRLELLAGRDEAGYADGQGTEAQFAHVRCMALRPDGTVVAVDEGNNRLRLLDPETGTVTTLAGSGKPGYADGQGTDAEFERLNAAVVSGEDTIYVAVKGRIRRVTVRGLPPPPLPPGIDGRRLAEVRTVAGSGTLSWRDGPLPEAGFLYPRHMAKKGDHIFLTEAWRVRRIDLAQGRVTTVLGDSKERVHYSQQAPATHITGGGSGGAGTDTGDNEASLAAAAASVPMPVSSSSSSLSSTLFPLMFSPPGMTTDSLQCTEEAGPPGQMGPSSHSSTIPLPYCGQDNTVHLDAPQGLAFDRAGRLVVADSASHSVVKIDLATGRGTVVAGPESGIRNPLWLTLDAADSIIVCQEDMSLVRVDAQTGEARKLPFKGRCCVFHDNGALIVSTGSQIYRVQGVGYTPPGGDCAGHKRESTGGAATGLLDQCPNLPCHSPIKGVRGGKG